MIKDDNYFMNKAYEEAIKAYNKNEIPIGAVIVKNKKIISKAYNLRDSSNIVTKHAEIIAIEKANKKLKNWRLCNTILYTTLEPCEMCEKIIEEAKIEKIIYGAKNNKKLNNNLKYYQISSKDIIYKCEMLIKNKFKDIRINKNVEKENVTHETLEKNEEKHD